MRRHQAARKRMRGQMKNFKYLMQSLVQQVGGLWFGSFGWVRCSRAACCAHAVMPGKLVQAPHLPSLYVGMRTVPYPALDCPPRP